MTIKELRVSKGMTQKQCAEYLNIPLRTYCRYESGGQKINPIKYQYIIGKLNSYGYVDEEHGILSIDQIQAICSNIFPSYSVDYAYLFGSYARGTATETSDIDLLISVPIDGLKFFELVEVLRQNLRKKIDLLDLSQLDHNPSLTNEILKDGIRIYG